MAITHTLVQALPIALVLFSCRFYLSSNEYQKKKMYHVAKIFSIFLFEYLNCNEKI